MEKDDFSFENIKKLKYIDMVQKEVTRIYGPVSGPFFRDVVKDHYFAGIHQKRINNGHFLPGEPPEP